VGWSALQSCRRGTCTLGPTLPVRFYEQLWVSIASDPERARGLQRRKELVLAQKMDDGRGRIPYQSLSMRVTSTAGMVCNSGRMTTTVYRCTLETLSRSNGRVKQEGQRGYSIEEGG